MERHNLCTACCNLSEEASAEVFTSFVCLFVCSFVCLFVLFVLFAHVFICIAVIETSLSIRNMLFPFALVGNH